MFLSLFKCLQLYERQVVQQAFLPMPSSFCNKIQSVFQWTVSFLSVCWCLSVSVIPSHFLFAIRVCVCTGGRGCMCILNWEREGERSSVFFHHSALTCKVCHIVKARKMALIVAQSLLLSSLYRSQSGSHGFKTTTGDLPGVQMTPQVTQSTSAWFSISLPPPPQFPGSSWALPLPPLPSSSPQAHVHIQTHFLITWLYTFDVLWSMCVLTSADVFYYFQNQWINRNVFVQKGCVGELSVFYI